MPTYEATKNYMMRVWPTLFPTEHDVLCDIFFEEYCVEWVNGEAVAVNERRDFDNIDAVIACNRKHDIDNFRREKAWWAEFNDNTHMDDYFDERIAELDLPIEEQWARETVRRIEMLDDDMDDCFMLHDDGSISVKARSVGAMGRLPGDVKPDWLAAAVRAVGFLRSGHIRADQSIIDAAEAAVKAAQSR